MELTQSGPTMNARDVMKMVMIHHIKPPPKKGERERKEKEKREEILASAYANISSVLP